MSKKRNAGQRAARANMAYAHREANDLVKCAALDKALDDFIERKRTEFNDSMYLLAPLLGKDPLLKMGLGSMFGITLMDPRAIAGISSIDTGRVRSDERRMTLDVPPLFAPRDNGHRQSADDLEKLEQLISESTYVPPAGTRDRFERPDWGPDVVLKDGRHPDAGEWGKLCFRTACQRPHAFFYNSGTYKHYCRKCADAIDRENMGGFKLHHLAEFEGQPAAA